MNLNFGAQTRYTWQSSNEALDSRKKFLSTIFSRRVLWKLAQPLKTVYAVTDSTRTLHLLNGPEADMFGAIQYAEESLKADKEEPKPIPGGLPLQDIAIDEITDIAQQAYTNLLNLPRKAVITDVIDLPFEP